MHAYLWDRYYGISLAKYKHADVVNSVAFNPKDSEMLVTTSDDYTIKVCLKKDESNDEVGIIIISSSIPDNCMTFRCDIQIGIYCALESFCCVHHIF